jgi:predicted ATPase
MADPITPLAQAIAGRYEILRPIGEGAFATVFLATDLRHGRRVAIKVLRVDPASDRGELRFLREIRLLAQLQHPNILPLYDSGHVGNLLYYVMPYVAGETLRERLGKQRRLPVQEVVEIGRELAEALAHAHAAGVVHRDVKPENILLSGGRPLLADFGVARVTPQEPHLTRTGDASPGTPAYMSPEQLAGQHEVDGRADVYALGCVLYELVTGSHPFAGPGGYVRRFAESPPSIADKCPEAPAALADALRRALATLPDERFASAHEFSRALDAAQDELRGVAPASGRKAPRRRRRRETSPRPPAGAAPVRRAAPVAPISNSFVGRDAEVATLTELLREARVVTLVGPGGIGKTRLAQQVAALIGPRFRHGVHFVPLGAVASADLIWAAAGEAIGIGGTDHRDARTRLLAALRRRHCLLVLDAYEHLVGAASVVNTILERTPRTQLLVTSRERLNVSAEMVVQLGGLPAPGRAEAPDPSRHAALRLFADRARCVRTDFALTPENATTVGRICSLVDGFPLAVELAASMLTVLDVEEVASELTKGFDILATTLRDVPPRHRSLRVVFDQSWSLLSPTEREALMALAVFEESFSREAASHVAGATLTTIRALADKSLLQPLGAGRYRLHDLVRQNARERMRESGRAREWEDAHTRYFAEFVRARVPRLGSGEERVAADELAQEIAELRAGWRRAVRTDDESLVWDYLEGMFLLYRLRSWFREGIAELEPTLDLSRRTRTTARVLARYGVFLIRVGEFERGRNAHRRSIEILRALGDDREMLTSLVSLGEVALTLGKWGAAERLMRRGVRTAEEKGDPHGLATALTDLANTLLPRGRLDEAERLLRRSIELLEPGGETTALAIALTCLGVVLADRGELSQARGVLLRALDVGRVTGSERIIGAELLNLGMVAHLSGDQESAKAPLDEALQRLRAVGVEDGAIVALQWSGEVEAALGRLEAAMARYREALRSAMRCGADRRVMSLLVSVAALFARRGDGERALDVLEFVRTQRATEAGERARAESLLAELLIGRSLAPRVLTPGETLHSVVRWVLEELTPRPIAGRGGS